MKQAQKRLGIGARIATGFLVVLVLMASLAAVGLHYISKINERLKDIVENNNVKIELATSMQTALRERALSMHALSVLTDPFDKDAEIQRFDALGSDYIRARRQLERMPLSSEESAILERIRVLTRTAQPEVQAVVDMAMNGRADEMFERIRNIAMPWQRQIAEQVNALIQVQKRQTAAAVKSAEASYGEVRNLMLLLGAFTLFSGLVIAFFVSRQAQLAAKALYDPLTGLPNRNLLKDRLEQAIAQSQRDRRSFGVALMDLNRFKEVNDTLGHDVGDELLREVAARLRQAVRAEDTVARMGGDEFVVILHDLTEQDVPAFSSKLLASLGASFAWGIQSIDLGASIGISLFPTHAKDPRSLIRFADIAMYAAKRSGKGYALYAPGQEQVSLGDLSLKSELREAIHSNQLCLHFQPKICLVSHRTAGLEALVRWNHPRRGLLLPDSFIPHAEEAGLIEFLTQWVLKTALEQLALLHARGHHLNMAVNLSAHCLHVEELPTVVSGLLSRSCVPAKYLTLEITESAIMSNDADVLANLSKLDRMGIMLAIDDFGTGYSSLAHLKQLPVDEIKIDKSFVIDMEENDNDAVIVRSTIDLGHNLGLKVTAEGVETEDAWDVLAVLGCDHSQGYYMSKPLPADRLIEWLEESPWTKGVADRPQQAAARSTTGA
jgi:diguanylate cyclase (GGDEF)-like protein